MSVPTAPGRAPRHAELLEVAVRLFYEKGYPHTTLQDIAERMGFTKAAIYYYAKNKEELLVECYVMIVEPALARARQIADEPDVDGASRFVAIVEQHLRIFLRHVEANAVFDVQNYSLSEPARKRMRALGREYNAVLRSVYDDGVADGSIRRGNAKITVNAVLGMCNSVHRWYSPGGRIGVGQIVDELTALVERAVRRPVGDEPGGD